MTLADLVTSPERRARYRADGHWDDTTLSGQVGHLALTRPSDVAVIDNEGARRRTYAELDADATTVAGYLRQVGVNPGDVVSVQLPNWYETVVADVAAQRAGAVINPLLPVYRRRELLHVFAVAAPKVIFTPGHYRGWDHRGETQNLISGLDQPVVHVVVGPEVTGTGSGSGDRAGEAVALADILALAGRSGPDALDGAATAQAVSELIFTSGTEATPKAIMHTEETANFGVRSAVAALGLGSGDVVWMPSPIGHSTGFNFGVRLALCHGLPLVLQDRWDAAVALALIVQESASYTLASTTFLQDLVVHAEKVGGRLPSMRLFGCGGATVPPDLVRRASALGMEVLRLYGSTEALVATWNRPTSPGAKKIETDGLALPHIDVEVRRDDGSRAPTAEPGEIFVRGPETCVGFFRDPARTGATFVEDGWVASGDLATIDDDGYLTVVGRKKELVIRGGMNIAPREIEELILAFPEVDRVAVVGVADERLGERVCACVVLADGATLGFDDMTGRLRAIGLATYKLPERLEILSELPMTASGKVQKHVIVANLPTD